MLAEAAPAAAAQTQEQEEEEEGKGEQGAAKASETFRICVQARDEYIKTVDDKLDKLEMTIEKLDKQSRKLSKNDIGGLLDWLFSPISSK
eukprot:COSAG06_NODE_60299_length_271_cov_0.779070_1_plen_89_part_11